MCQICDNSPCLNGCPNDTSDEKIIGTCQRCGEPIYQGYGYKNSLGEPIYCNCVNELTVPELIGMLNIYEC